MALHNNKLDEFQSHSIHYVMLAGRTTEGIRPFTEGGDAAMSQTLQAIDAAKSIGASVRVPGTNTDDVFLIMDTRRFSQFAIDSLQMTTAVSGFSVPGSSSPHSVGQELAFNILDSTGISFINFLQYLMDKRLKVSYEGFVGLLRIMFVGHSDDGSTKIVQSIGIPFRFSDITLDLNEVKGVYSCKCIPMVGMISNSAMNASLTCIGSASNYFTGAGSNTLGGVIRSFESRLNEESLLRYNSLNGITQAAGEGQKEAGRIGRPVQYMITIPKEWETFTFSGPTQHAATEINFKQLLADEESKKAKSAAEQQKKAQANAAAPAKDSYIAVDPTLTITEVLDVIFSQTIGVQELGNFKQPKTDQIKFYKHLISTTSDDSSFTVHVDVVEFTVPNVELESGAKVSQNNNDYLTELVQEPGRAPKRVPKNYMEFDYIFSGNNLDVLSLDLKLEKLNLLLMQKTKIGQAALAEAADDAQQQTDGETNGESKTPTFGRAAKDPVPLRMLTPQERTNFSNLAGNIKTTTGASPNDLSQEYTRNIAAFYNIGTQAKMTIRGNPEYFDRLTLNTLPKHVNVVTNTSTGISESNPNVKAKWREDFEKRILRMTPGLTNAPGGGFKVSAPLQGPSFATTPVFVKVNVFGPNVNFITLDPIAGGQDFAKELLTDNFYFATKIISKIDGSKFVQELELRSFSVYGIAGATAQNAQTNAVKEVK